MPLPKDQAWFPAKTYGWGWGIPRRWQGWIVMVGFLAAMVAGAPLVKVHPLAYVGYSMALGCILVTICYWKGEKPGWHWGAKER